MRQDRLRESLSSGITENLPLELPESSDPALIE